MGLVVLLSRGIEPRRIEPFVEKIRDFGGLKLCLQ